MSSVKAVKRKSVQKKNNRKVDRNSLELKRSQSLSELHISNATTTLRRIKSEVHLESVLKETTTNNLKIAKSERKLNSVYTSSVPNTSMTHNNNNNSKMEESSYSMIADNDSIKIPIVGYEVMEERSRFTIFKLRIENYEKNSFWLVLRRFTDFSRLHAKLKQLYPNVNLVLPKKKWFGNNFSAGFLDTRVAGLQTFINTVLGNAEMRKCPAVREFFCLDEPPSFSESMEDCKAIFEAQEETIAYLKMQLKAKDEIISNLTQKNDYLTSLVKSSIGKCSKTDNSF